jgi:riboflavin biosynthesis pyrimidine reductase
LTIDNDSAGCVDLHKLFAELGRRHITSILIEGGASVITSAVREKLVDRLIIVIAPKIIGKGLEAIGDLGIKIMDEALRLSQMRIFRKGADIVVTGRMG